jgi:hypothetical protein
VNGITNELKPENLRWVWDPSVFSFDTTADIPPLKSIVAQDKPSRAIHFGLDCSSPGYNIHVGGLTRTSGRCFHEGSVNYRIEQRLKDFAEGM